MYRKSPRSFHFAFARVLSRNRPRESRSFELLASWFQEICRRAFPNKIRVYSKLISSVKYVGFLQKINNPLYSHWIFGSYQAFRSIGPRRSKLIQVCSKQLLRVIFPTRNPVLEHQVLLMMQVDGITFRPEQWVDWNKIFSNYAHGGWIEEEIFYTIIIFSTLDDRCRTFSIVSSRKPFRAFRKISM